MSYIDEIIIWDGPEGVAVTSAAPTDRAMIEVGVADLPEGIPFWVVKIADLPIGTMPEDWVIADIVGGRDADGVGEGSPVSQPAALPVSRSA